MTKKSFNPANWSNQRQVWEARQKHESEKKARTERQTQLSRERDEEELARAVGGEVDGGRKALGFMYDAGKVPGLERKKNENDFVCGKSTVTVGVNKDENTSRRGEGGEVSIFDRQAGDDDAAAAFRAMLARPPPESPPIEQVAGVAAAATRPSESDDGDNDKSRDRDQRTNLEKAVGRGINSGSGVTLTQQFERFPMLKTAPMVLQKPATNSSGGTETSMTGLNFKPLGQVLRNVQCLACRQWGHARGDRECKLSGWDPFAVSSSVTAVPASAASCAIIKSESALDVVTKGSNLVRKSDRRKDNKKKRRRRDGSRKKEKHRHKRRRRHGRSLSYSSSDSAPSCGDKSYSKGRGKHHNHRNEE